VLQYWPLIAVAAVLMTVEGAALGGFAYLIQPLFDDLFAAGSMSGVAWVAFAIAGLFLLRAIAGFTQRLMITWIGLNVTTTLQTRLVNHLLALDMRFFRTTRQAP
jgi:subfamily B ATP-binding cassette protein MsbA